MLMKRFQSRYESLLRVKEQAEQVAQLQQELARRELERTTDFLRQLEERLLAASAKLAAWMGTQLHASQLLVHRQQVEQLQREITRVRTSATSIEAAFRQATERRLDLTKELETLRHAREFELREYRKEYAQSSQQLSDDHAVRQWGRPGS
ncbi:MAG: hypothetical protein EA424_06900 [Planctomycetaceae bacterium]|jgi:flagellar biosynthesis chaperone FliJ|nr:MAG: hypothetical protein EA424_06900 [Planctomycetaceae bacterium]